MYHYNYLLSHMLEDIIKYIPVTADFVWQNIQVIAFIPGLFSVLFILPNVTQYSLSLKYKWYRLPAYRSFALIILKPFQKVCSFEQ